MTRASFDLVCFGPSTEAIPVVSTLSALGERAKLIPGEEWLAMPATAPALNHPPLLLFLYQADYPSDRVRSVLATEQRLTFVLFGMRDGGLDKEIATRCHDFLHWPCSQDELALRLQRWLEPSAPLAVTTAELELFTGLNLVGRSEPFQAALASIRKLAACDAPVLIEGETGTGKELAARALHYLGARRDHPFIPVNCGAIPDNLFENELFGHERGAFTDAKLAQSGLVAEAEGGTLFLDELETLSGKGQVTLLRFLQDRNYKPLGARAIRQANVRIVAASNRDLDDLAAAGAFREDLLHRLKIFPLRLPPLRERPGDARLLAEHFLDRYSAHYRRPPKSLHPGTHHWFDVHSWPGNVRELENFIHREFLMGDDPVIRIRGGSPKRERRNSLLERRSTDFAAAGFQQAKQLTVAQFEKAYLRWALTETQGNVTLAAKRVNKERRAFGKLLKKYGIHPEQYRSLA